jgi:hypothetical protein
MQPLLLMKQTLLDMSAPSGALQLDGSNVSFSDLNQLFWKERGSNKQPLFCIKLSDTYGISVSQTYTINDNSLQISGLAYKDSETEYEIDMDMDQETLRSKCPIISKNEKRFKEKYPNADIGWILWDSRGMLRISAFDKKEKDSLDQLAYPSDRPMSIFQRDIQSILHVPGMRGIPERQQSRHRTKGNFPGPFQYYTGGIIEKWQSMHEPGGETSFQLLKEYFSDLSLGWEIQTKSFGGAIEIEVSRIAKFRKGVSRDMVNIADVGFGVSHVLPVLVALLTAQPGQIVYIEQPEIHLHPRAQWDLAKILADAANRGVIVIAETHSDQLLMGVQHQVASGQIGSDKTMLHWFERDEDGASHITSTELDEHGTYGDWPEDFSSVIMKNHKEYLDASLTWD